MSTGDDFLTIFNLLEKELKRRYGGTRFVGFKRMVDQLSHRDSLVDMHKEDLIEYVELRNAIVHRSTGQPIADPRPEVIKRLQHIHDLLTHPPMAADLAKKPVFTCKLDTPLTEVVSAMKENRYSYIPVYEDQKFVGVFSEMTITRWLASIVNQGTFDFNQQTVGDLKEFFDQSDDKHNAYYFVSAEDSVFEIRQQFLSFLDDEKRLGAVFVTQNGQADEDILGIITVWDIPKISKKASIK